MTVTPAVRSWPDEEFVATYLDPEVAARQPNGGALRIRAARLPGRKSFEDFDFAHHRSLRHDVSPRLGALDFIAAGENVVFLRSPGVSKMLWPGLPVDRHGIAAGW